MNDQRNQAKKKAIEEELGRRRDRLDQLVKAAEDEDINITRETTEGLIEIQAELRILEEEANKTTGNQRLMASIRKERDRCREALGLKPRRRRRG